MAWTSETRPSNKQISFHTTREEVGGPADGRGMLLNCFLVVFAHASKTLLSNPKPRHALAPAPICYIPRLLNSTFPKCYVSFTHMLTHTCHPYIAWWMMTPTCTSPFLFSNVTRHTHTYIAYFRNLEIIDYLPIFFSFFGFFFFAY